jgi:hypothetical protein
LLLLASAAARCAARLAEKRTMKNHQEKPLYYFLPFLFLFGIFNLKQNLFVSGEIIATKRAGSSYRRKPWEFYWEKPSQITGIDFYFFFFSFCDVF